MNNEPDYKDNLAFEPEMTWEQLVKWAKNDKRYKMHPNKTLFRIRPDLYFNKDGRVETFNFILAENVTPAKMKLIIEGLM